MNAAPRHSWDAPARLARKTERACRNCGIVRVTRHEPGARAWQEFWRGLDRVDSDGRTPPCAPADSQPQPQQETA